MISCQKMNYQSLCLLITATCVSSLLMGCGGGGPTMDVPPRYAVSGNVTYGGKPLPSGEIQFDPTTKAPSASATITDGKYSIPASNGVVGGSYTVRVLPPMLESGSTIPPDMANFEPYTETRDLPKETSTLDVDVPRATK